MKNTPKNLTSFFLQQDQQQTPTNQREGNKSPSLWLDNSPCSSWNECSARNHRKAERFPSIASDAAPAERRAHVSLQGVCICVCVGNTNGVVFIFILNWGRRVCSSHMSTHCCYCRFIVPLTLIRLPPWPVKWVYVHKKFRKKTILGKNGVGGDSCPCHFIAERLQVKSILFI